MNAYATVAQRWMAELSARSGYAARQESPAFGDRAVAIRKATHSTFATSGSGWSTSSVGPSLPIPKEIQTCAHVWRLTRVPIP